MFTYEFTNDLGEKTKRTINLDSWDTLIKCARETVELIPDDSEFCAAEYELFNAWYREKGFTNTEKKYVEACGYDWDFDSNYFIVFMGDDEFEWCVLQSTDFAYITKVYEEMSAPPGYSMELRVTREPIETYRSYDVLRSNN